MGNLGSLSLVGCLGLEAMDRLPVAVIARRRGELLDLEHQPPVQIHTGQDVIAYVEVSEVHRPGDPEASRGPPTLIIPDSYLSILRIDPLHQPVHPDDKWMAGEGDSGEEQHRRADGEEIDSCM